MSLPRDEQGAIVWPSAGIPIDRDSSVEEVVAWVEHLRNTRDHRTLTFSTAEVDALGWFTFRLCDEIVRLREYDRWPPVRTDG